MSNELSQMDYEAVERVAKGFKDSGVLLQGIDKAIDALLLMLRTTSFVGLISAAMLESYTNSVQTELNKLVDIFNEMSGDLSKTVQATRERDEQIGTKFTN